MLDSIIKNSNKDLENSFKIINDIEEFNSKKVLDAFIENSVCETDFNSATGYGYNDIGRDKIERVYASIFKAENALVRCQFISGTHAISTCLFALLRPGDTMLSISGKPYDTLDSVIGFNNNSSSLMSYNVDYKEIDLIDNDFDYDGIREVLSNSKIKLIEIQRSKGYSTRESISIDKIEKVVKTIRNIDKDVIIMVDNCYCEMVSTKEPTEVGVDICVGSLIKNLGGAITSNGGYIVGRKDLINLCAERLNVPGQGAEVGPSLNQNRYILQGLYMSPMIVANALKTAVYTAYLFEKLGYKVSPRYDDDRIDIVQNIIFENEKDLISYVRGIQSNSKIDSNAIVEPSDMPGYDDKIIMASGSFTQGSSIELSCDGPLRYPYIAYQQGSISYKYGKIIVERAINSLLKNK
ncbi:MAG: methionine gamma-lyase family protein [Bacilli bacterium]|nr:methionine gamma-lyase family protein [Bacilli bacterium]